MIIPCPKCKHRLFSIYVGGAKEMGHDKMWWKECKQIQNGRGKISDRSFQEAKP